MSIQHEIEDIKTRLAALELQQQAQDDIGPSDVAIINMQLHRVSKYLFGSQRDKSNVVD